mmetsp:Transcript_5598/g.8612  ORF Transcript_5598/g.8612 Transcript_5598/m.8612 type:complete len:217 (+) Transcript_5598:349-999(+)
MLTPAYELTTPFIRTIGWPSLLPIWKLMCGSSCCIPSGSGLPSLTSVFKIGINISSSACSSTSSSVYRFFNLSCLEMGCACKTVACSLSLRLVAGLVVLSIMAQMFSAACCETKPNVSHCSTASVLVSIALFLYLLLFEDLPLFSSYRLLSSFILIIACALTFSWCLLGHSEYLWNLLSLKPSTPVHPQHSISAVMPLACFIADSATDTITQAFFV